MFESFERKSQVHLYCTFFPLEHLLCIFPLVPPFSKHFAISWHHGLLQVYLVFTLPWYGINHYFKKLWFLYWTMVLEIKIRGLDVLMTVGVFLPLGPPSGQS